MSANFSAEGAARIPCGEISLRRSRVHGCRLFQKGILNKAPALQEVQVRFVECRIRWKNKSEALRRQGTAQNKKIPEAEASGNLLEVTTRFELVDEGFADPCLTTWPRHHIRE